MCTRDDSVSGDRKWTEPSRSSGLLLMYISLINDAKGKKIVVSTGYIQP